MSDVRNRPATLLPPPLVYAVGLGAAWWLERRFPWGWQPSQGVHLLAWAMLAVSVLLMLWAAATVWHHRSTVNPYRGASSLVTGGPFTFSRNPIYLADALAYAAVTLLMGSVWPLCLAPLVWATMRYGVIAHEEAHLRAKFGAQYQDYCARVNRWFGRRGSH